MRNKVFIVGLTVITACAPLQEVSLLSCLDGANKNLSVLDNLIATTQGNIDRGYAIDNVDTVERIQELCSASPAILGYDSPFVQSPISPFPATLFPGDPVFCYRDVIKTKNVPRAINIENEQQILNGLLAKRKQAQIQRDHDITTCHSAYDATS